MEADWSVAIGAEDAAIETGWSDTESDLAWVDLRVEPELQRKRIDVLPEALWPAMARALTLWNTPQGDLMTAKCDRWLLSDAEQAELAVLLDEPMAAFGYGSYIDLLMSHPVPRCDFQLHEEWVRVATRRASALAIDEARLELVVRPALHAGAWGFGVTVYHYAQGDTFSAAETFWQLALDATAPVLVSSAAEMFAAKDDVERPANGRS